MVLSFTFISSISYYFIVELLSFVDLSLIINVSINLYRVALQNKFTKSQSAFTSFSSSRVHEGAQIKTGYGFQEKGNVFLRCPEISCKTFPLH